MAGFACLATLAVSTDLASAKDLSVKAELGKRMFFDTRLSNPPGQSCASCHDPAFGFADPDSQLPASAGVIPGRFGSRNAPAVAYAAFSPALHFDPTIRPGSMQGGYVGGQFWDGRADSLEDQAVGPLLNPLEMNNPDKRSVVRKISIAEYAGLFREVFGPDSLSLADVNAAFTKVAEAIAAYERSPEVNPFSSKFDRFLDDPKGSPLTDSEARGFALFTGKADCQSCHSVDTTLAGRPLFTRFEYKNIGVPANPENPFYNVPLAFNPEGKAFVDPGLGAVTGDAAEYGRFKVPTLRNVARTSPYMHNGVFKSLREVVMFYNTRHFGRWSPPEVSMNVEAYMLPMHGHMGGRHGHMAPMHGGMGGMGGHMGGMRGHMGGMHMPCMGCAMGRLGLTHQEIDDIVAFLHTLSDGYAK
jgi:cytochrome c peroxidase